MGTHGYNIKTYVVGTHEKHLIEVFLMSTRTFFRGEIRKIFLWITLLSGAMEQQGSKYLIIQENHLLMYITNVASGKKYINKMMSGKTNIFLWPMKGIHIIFFLFLHENKCRATSNEYATDVFVQK